MVQRHLIGFPEPGFTRPSMKSPEGTSLLIQWSSDSALPLQGTRVQSLVREPRSLMPHGKAKTNKPLKTLWMPSPFHVFFSILLHPFPSPSLLLSKSNSLPPPALIHPHPSPYLFRCVPKNISHTRWSRRKALRGQRSLSNVNYQVNLLEVHWPLRAPENALSEDVFPTCLGSQHPKPVGALLCAFPPHLFTKCWFIYLTALGLSWGMQDL